MSVEAYFNDKIVWVTGASSGIGEALVKNLARLGAKVILSSHEPEQLERVVKETGKTKYELKVFPFDLSDPNQVENAAKKIIAEFGHVDIFFTNGGISTRTKALETSISTDRKVMEINYFSGVIISKILLPEMLKNQFGHIVATSSISGKFGFPLRSAYAASKHALHGFYESVWTEYHKEGIRTTLICPGRVRTNISIYALGTDGKSHGKMDAGQAGGISPGECARKILKSVSKNRREVLVGGKELIMPRIKQYFPRLFYRLVVKIKPT